VNNDGKHQLIMLRSHPVLFKKIPSKARTMCKLYYHLMTHQSN